MDAPPFVEAVHAGWVFIMDDKVPVYITQKDSASTGDEIPISREDIDMVHRVPGVEEDHRPSLVIDNMVDPSALLDPEMEASIRTKGVYIGYARIEDNDLPLYMMPQEDIGAEEVAAETGDEDETPGLFPDKQDEDLNTLETDFNNNPGIQEASLSSFEERILQALGGFEMLTIREAYLEASRIHDTLLEALPTEDYPLTGRVSRAASYCGAVLKSFRRQMVRGIKHGIVTTMLLHLGIVVNVLEQVFPTPRDTAAGTAAPPPKDDSDERDSAHNASKVIKHQASEVVSQHESYERITRASPNPPTELDVGFDGAQTSAVHKIGEQQELSGEDAKANTKTRITDDGSDDWSWEDVAEADDFAEVLGWEML